MKTYEVSIYTKKNSYYIPDRFIEGFVVSAENPAQARELAFELFREMPRSDALLPRGCFRLEVELLK